MRCVEREKLSPAESSFCRDCLNVHPGADQMKADLDYSFCEVRPGVGPVKKMKSVIAGSGITHVTCTEGRIRVI